jgi:hypothetical protein
VSSPGISISHPSGLPKKIARDNTAPQDNGLNWVVDWEVGKIEPGSSGSPLFSGHKRVLGPACCVTAFSCRQLVFYGNFGRFYADRNLGQWLDPLDQDPEFMDGIDPHFAYAVAYLGSNSNPYVYKSTSRPALGTTWTAEISAYSLPSATSTWISAYPAPSSGTFVAQGEILVDTSMPRVFHSVAGVSAGLSMHASTIPNRASLVGRVYYTQGLVLDTVPLSLTNGVELHLR